ncbi:MAG: sortase [Gaiellales bacterium]
MLGKGLPRLLIVTIAALVLATNASGGEPPNRNDPCSKFGKNTCGTNGVGFYDTYRYGIRWFGDFKAVPGQPRGFCIDLRYWYPSPTYQYKEDASGSLVNRDGEVVPLESQRRMAYAVWTFGRSSNPSQQAAVMLYVHSLMGDARPGEASPDELSASVREAFARVSQDSAAYHGPYRIAVSMPSRLKLGEKGTATIRLVAASGKAVPAVKLSLSATGTSGVPGSVTTDAAGAATVTFTATSAADASISARSEAIASTLPRIFTPTTAAAKRNGQRLVLPGSQIVTSSGTAGVAKTKPEVKSVAEPAEIVAGEASTDKVTITGAAETFKVTVDARLYGPFRSRNGIRCAGTPAWKGTWRTAGSGTFSTKPVKLEEPGWYVYQHVIPSDANHVGQTSPCSDLKERVKVVAAPKVTTVVSTQTAEPGGEISDTVKVEGLAGERATVSAALYGPFASRDAITCTGTPLWQGTLQVNGDGEYETETTKLTVPGFYTYHEKLVGGEFVRPAETKCGEAVETTIVTGTPLVRTQVSAQQTSPGSTITDRVIVSGLGALSGAVEVELFGPFPTRGAISCSGTPVWKGTVVANGDGTYTTQPFTITKVGYYTYREKLLETPQYAAFEGKCGESAETTVAKAKPRVTTLVSSEVVAPGATISDTVKVSGLGDSAARVDVELFGPFAARDAIRCTGSPFWKGSFTAKGDGSYKTQPVRLARAGFYTYRESLPGSELITEVETECGEVSETALARPLILTGTGDRTTSAHARAAAPSPLTPTRVQLEARGIDAAVFTAGIDLSAGALDVPSDIRRTGWWGDGVLPGSPRGAVLIAGHVDSAKAGAGAFYRLKEARAGDRVRVTTKGGRVFTYKVVSVQQVEKSKLPTDIYARQGRPRLVLVTCGGPFNASQGHYRDNIIVTAVPG